MAFVGGRRVVDGTFLRFVTINVVRRQTRRMANSASEDVAHFGYAWSLPKKAAFLISLPTIWMTGSTYLRGCEDGANENNVIVKLRKRMNNKKYQWEEEKVHPLTWFMAKYMIMDPKEREEYWENHLREMQKRRELTLARLRQPTNPPVTAMHNPTITYQDKKPHAPRGPDGY